MAERERSKQTSAAAAAGAAVAVAAAGGATSAPTPPEPPPPSAIARAIETVLSAFMVFVDATRIADRKFLTETLTGRGSEDEIQRTVEAELDREQAFVEKQRERVRARLGAVYLIPDEGLRERAVRGVMNQERHYVRSHRKATAARAIASVERQVLRTDSPQGAYWKLNPNVKEHTVGCLILGNKFWPWAVLDRVHPPRHPGCPCRLLGYDEALSAGVIAATDIIPTPDMLRAAAGVVMEGDGHLYKLADDMEAVQELLRRDMADERMLADAGLQEAVTILRGGD